MIPGHGDIQLARLVGECVENMRVTGDPLKSPKSISRLNLGLASSDPVVLWAQQCTPNVPRWYGKTREALR